MMKLSSEEFETINEVLAQYSEEYIVGCVNQATRAASPKVPQDNHIMDAFVYGTGFMRDGKRVDQKDVYAGARIWIGDKSVTRIVPKAVMISEIYRFNALTAAAQECLDLLAAAEEKDD